MICFSVALCLLPLALAAPQLDRRSQPTVTLKSGGVIVGSQMLGIDSFKGIPFAVPPVGQLRLKPPQGLATPVTGTLTATGTPRACPQFTAQYTTTSVPVSAATMLAGAMPTAASDGEDCLTINVQRPSTATNSTRLPVLLWIYGGGFESGSTTAEDGGNLIAASIQQNKGILFVQANFRLGGFGFLGGSEIFKDGSSNLGLLDQRLAMQWVADNIASFGGDPDRVTIWGESAGAISVWDQMALYDGNNLYNNKPLFRGAIMNSGSVIPANRVDSARPQAIYDTVVSAAGCSTASDTLACLRSVDYTTFKNAADSVPNISGYEGIALSYLPRPDGTVLTDSPDILAAKGLYARVPYIIGDCEDEGTAFSLAQNNITTTSQLVDYLSSIVFQGTARSTVQGLVNLYPDDPSAGSPYYTSLLYNVYPQFKRLAAMQGDFVFTLARRVWLQTSAKSSNVPSWSYLATNLRGLPALGTFHSSDVYSAFGVIPSITSDTFMAYYLSFVNTLDPNNGTSTLFPQWPQWQNGKQLVQFQSLSNNLITNDFRQNASDYLTAHVDELRI